MQSVRKNSMVTKLIIVPYSFVSIVCRLVLAQT